MLVCATQDIAKTVSSQANGVLTLSSDDSQRERGGSEELEAEHVDSGDLMDG
jgi:hypothetical protein